MGKAHAPGFLAIVEDAKRRVKECTLADVLARQAAGETPVLVDVREESEYAAGRVPGAVQIGKGVIERDIEAKVHDHNTPLVLYCGGGYRSALAADALQKMGYTQVISMDGGWRAYSQAGLPVER
jgi:rhodanese-related sulfurtransferase